MLRFICIASHVPSRVPAYQIRPKSFQMSSYTAHTFLLGCFSYCWCGIHLQKPLFLNHTTGICIHCTVTPVNPGFKLVPMNFGLICDGYCYCFVSVQLPNVISTGMCEWDGERRIFSMCRRGKETGGLTLEEREIVMSDVSTMEYKDAKPRHSLQVDWTEF